MQNERALFRGGDYFELSSRGTQPDSAQTHVNLPSAILCSSLEDKDRGKLEIQRRGKRGEGEEEEMKRMKAKIKKKKKNAARGIPRWSPTPVLTTPEGA